MASDDPASVVDALFEAFNSRDHEILRRLFTRDARFVNIFGACTSGADQIVEAHRQIFSTVLIGSKISMTELDSIPLGSEVTVCQARWRSELLPDATPTTPPPATGINTIVLHHERSEWRIAVFTNVKDVAAPGAQP